MKRDIDFLEIYKKRTRYKYKIFTLSSKIDKASIYIIIALIVVSTNLLLYKIYINNLTQQTNLNIKTSDYAASYEIIKDKQSIYEDASFYNQMISETIAKIEDLPQLTNVEYQTIKNNLSLDMHIMSMNYSQGTYVLTIGSPNTRSIPQYVSNIKKSGIFSNISYNGYELKESASLNITDISQIINNQYVFTITCTLKSGASNDKIN